MGKIFIAKSNFDKGLEAVAFFLCLCGLLWINRSAARKRKGSFLV